MPLHLEPQAADPRAPDHETRAALQAGIARVICDAGKGADHELVIAVPRAQALPELVALLDRLLAIGEAAFAINTEEGWRQAHARTLDAGVLIRVSELRHALDATMTWSPDEKAGAKDATVAWMMALRGLRAQIEPDTLAPPDPRDIRYLESLLDGSGDLLSEDTFARLEPMFIRYAEGSETHALLERAATAFGDAVQVVAERALAQSGPDLAAGVFAAVLAAQSAARTAAAAAQDRLGDGIPVCGRAELRLCIEPDSVLWDAFFEAAASPAGARLFEVVATGAHEVELLIRELHLPPQGASVQAAALTAALAVLKAQLDASGTVHKIID